MTTEEAPLKPLPIPSALSEGFWAAANQQQLVIQRCSACKQYAHPPVAICRNCSSTDLAHEPVSGKGTIHSFTITYDARMPAFSAKVPYPVLMVELDEQPGLILYSDPDMAPDQVKIGQRVELYFEEVKPGHYLPQFRPTG